MSTSCTKCPSLKMVQNRHLFLESNPTDTNDQINFVVIADPQLGLYERYIVKHPKPYQWYYELSRTNRALRIINSLNPRPKFVIICGDLVDAQPGFDQRPEQIDDLLKSMSHLNSEIPLIVLPGNHDVGDKPESTHISEYKSIFGDDYYSFMISRVKFIVLNSQYFWDDSNCPNESEEFQLWLDGQLETRTDEFDMIIVFQHIPFFVEDHNEPDEYFNIPQKYRQTLLTKFSKANVRCVFSGHLHRNKLHIWNESNGAPIQSHPINTSTIELITSSALGAQIGPDQSGLRLVQINKLQDSSLMSPYLVKHQYWTLDELESLVLERKKQPIFFE